MIYLFAAHIPPPFRKVPMVSRAQALFILIEFFNCYAAVYYSNFLFFFTRERLGFGAWENLLLAAAGGFVYIFAAWQGGKFAQRSGNVRAIALGVVGMLLALTSGLFFPTALWQIAVYLVWTCSVCFTWPALEAVICHGQGARLSDVIGLYNITWAGGSAIAYFTAGMLVERLGMRSLFWFPMALYATELGVLLVAARLARTSAAKPAQDSPVNASSRPANAQKFLHMAWLASPFSYVAINTLVPLIPSIAARLGLSTSMAGITCSLWMFARLGAFYALWHWTAWHYRARWLIGAFAAMTLTFAVLLVTRSLPVLLAAEVAFGLAVGLIYYCSLYYSLNASDSKGAYAGLHEAMIGAGQCLGPACGAASLLLFPLSGNAGAWSVSGLLAVAFGALAWMGRFRWAASTSD